MIWFFEGYLVIFLIAKSNVLVLSWMSIDSYATGVQVGIALFMMIGESIVYSPAHSSTGTGVLVLEPLRMRQISCINTSHRVRATVHQSQVPCVTSSNTPGQYYFYPRASGLVFYIVRRSVR